MVLTMGFYLFSLLTFTTMGLGVTLDTKGDAALPLKVQYKSAFSVVFQFQHAPLVKKPNIPYFYTDHRVTPDNLKTNAGVTTGDLNIDETGKNGVSVHSAISLGPPGVNGGCS
jgi:hypothetical protein